MATMPRLAFPIRFESDHFAETDQDTSDEVLDAIEFVLTTIIGERVESPEFGIADYLFSTSVDPEAVLGALNTWEDRARFEVSTAEDLERKFSRVINVRATMQSGDD